MLWKTGDIHRTYGGKAYLEVAIGRDRKKLAEQSPINRLQHLKVPVFIAHGRKDRRAPFEHAQNLRKSMEALDKPYVWFERKSEGHGYYNAENRVAYWQDVLAFLNKEIGGKNKSLN